MYECVQTVLVCKGHIQQTAFCCKLTEAESWVVDRWCKFATFNPRGCLLILLKCWPLFQSWWPDNSLMSWHSCKESLLKSRCVCVAVVASKNCHTVEQSLFTHSTHLGLVRSTSAKECVGQEKGERVEFTITLCGSYTLLFPSTSTPYIIFVCMTSQLSRWREELCSVL